MASGWRQGCAKQSFADFVFFANSGAEAMECAIKITRKYHAAKGHPERYRIITFEGAFHGRTLATLAATGSAKYLEGFGPPMDGFDQVPLGDLEAVKKAIGPHTAGILIEPLQGEGGVRAAPHAFFRALRQLCDDNGLLLVFDEVQTGMGRTGELFAYKRLGVTPDVMSLAKALGGGFPIGACLATAEAAAGMTPGSHGSTFGGNPLAVAAANAVLDVMLKPGFLEHVQKMSLLLKQKLASVVDRHPDVLAEVRGEGLLIGLKAVVPSGDLVDRAARREAAHGRRRRQRGAVPAAADRQRGGDRGIRAAARSRLRRAFRRSVATGGGAMSTTPRHFLDLSELPTRELRNMLAAGVAMKAKLKAHARPTHPLEGKTLAMIFEKPSTRTRVSFDVGMRQLGGESIMLTGAEMQLGRGETIADTARVLSRYVDAIMIRILNHDALLELAAYATVPVINGLTRRSHPCQVMADLMTFEEHRGPIEGRTVAWTGDDNNVLASWVACGGTVSIQVECRNPAAARAEQIDAGLDQGDPCADRARQRSGGGGARRRLRGHRYLVLDGRQGRRAPPQSAEAVSGQCQADVAGETRCAVHALPARPSRRRSHRRGDRRSAVGGVRRGREPPARAEGHSDVVFRRRGVSGYSRCSRSPDAAQSPLARSRASSTRYVSRRDALLIRVQVTTQNRVPALRSSVAGCTASGIPTAPFVPLPSDPR